MLTLLRSPDLDAARSRPRRCQGVAGDDARPPRTAADEQLLTWLDTYPPRQAASMKRLLAVQRAWRRRHGGCSTASSTDLACRRGWRTASSVAPATSTRRSCRNDCGRSAGSSPPISALSAMFDDGLDDIADAHVRHAVARGGRRLPRRARPPWQRRVRAGDAGVDHGPGAGLRGDRPPAPRAGQTATRPSSPAVWRPTPTLRWPRPLALLPGTSGGWSAAAPSCRDRDRSPASGPRTSWSWRTWAPGGCCTSWRGGPPSAAGRQTSGWPSASRPPSSPTSSPTLRTSPR